MAHPFSEHRAHRASKKRVGHIMKSGGHAHSDAAADKKLFKNLIAQHEGRESKAPGYKRGGRLDKFARGGRAKDHGKHQVNIAIVNPKGHEGAGAGAGPMPGPGAAPPPRPPMAGPPMMPPGMPPGGGPAGPMPGMPPGGMPGRPPFKRGGKVRGFAKGGKIGTTASVRNIKAGSESGIGRLQKIHAYGSKARRKQAR